MPTTLKLFYHFISISSDILLHKLATDIVFLSKDFLIDGRRSMIGGVRLGD